MVSLQLNGSPRTAARQLVELLTRDNILDEDGNVNQATVEAANNYARAPRQQTLDDFAIPPRPSADSKESSRNGSPAEKSESRTQEGSAQDSDSAHKRTT